MLEKSIIVAAHPDDEILWFSSIIDKVNEIVLCFLYRQHNNKFRIPDITSGREKSLQEYPIKTTSNLCLSEAAVFSSDNWNNPVTTKYGLKLSDKSISDKQYIKNYYILMEKLQNKLKGYQNVFTHNPWGEYGHEEHIQIYRVIRDLQKNMNFNIWYNNYCSTKSYDLMLRCISVSDSKYVTLKTNKILGNEIKDLYMKNNCWSWYSDWEWFNEESFRKDEIFESVKNKHNHNFPLNMVKVEYSKKKLIFRNFQKLSVGIARNQNKSN
ncbi:MAG: hypothetical protein E3K37_04855 [Candidatus Kuenenia sp.]|nr:hypothetical protein [Candidatus Kuenenia hertensis]